MRWVVVLFALLSGCYLSHRRLDDRDGSVPACAPIADVASFHAVILSASPSDCTIVGLEFDRRNVQLSEPLVDGCTGTVERSECAVTIDYDCWFPDLTTELRGTVTGGDSTIQVATIGGFSGIRCERSERWTPID